MKKLGLIVGIAICLLFAADRLYSFSRGYFPVAQPGECVSLTIDEGRKLKAVIVINDDKGHQSLALIELPNGELLPQAISYTELRDLKAKKVECDAKVD